MIIIITSLTVCGSCFDAIVIDMSSIPLFKSKIAPHYYPNYVFTNLLVSIIGSIPLEFSGGSHSSVLVGGAHLVVHGSLGDNQGSRAGDGAGLYLILRLHGVSVSLVGQISSGKEIHWVWPVKAKRKCTLNGYIE